MGAREGGEGRAGDVQPAPGRKVHSGILCKPGHEGTKGRGTSTLDTITPQARRNKKSILTHRGDTFCGDGIQAATRQGGVRTAASRGAGQRQTQERKQKQNQGHQYPRCAQPCTPVTVAVQPRGTLSPTQSRTSSDSTSGDVPLSTLPTLPTPLAPARPDCAPNPSFHTLEPEAWAFSPQDRALPGPHLVSWIHWWKALACWANSWRSLSFSSCRRCSFCSSSSLS